MGWRRWLLLVCLAACAPDSAEVFAPLEPAELEPVCDQPSPVRLLALDADQTLLDTWSAVTPIDDRLYFAVGRGSFRSQHIDDVTTLYSTGPCGEDPRTIGEGILRVEQREPWPGLLLGHTVDRDLVVLDPLGEVPPQVLMRDLWASGRWTESGFVEIASEDNDETSLLLRGYPGGPGDPEPEPVVLATWTRGPYGSEILEDEALVGVAPDEVHRIGVPDGAETVELIGAEAFEVTGDGRFIAWTSATQDAGFRTVRIRDRTTGAEVRVGETDRDFDLHATWLEIYARDLPDETQRLVLLPELDVVDVPWLVFLSERVDATRWVAWKNPSSFLLFDVEDGSTETLTSNFGYARLGDERLEVLIGTMTDSPDLRNQGRVEASWLDGTGTTRLADRATPGYLALADGRVATPLDVADSTSVGTLALTDSDGVTRYELDTDVVGWFRKYQHRTGFADDVLLYSVTDGGRSGLWVTGLPAD